MIYHMLPAADWESTPAHAPYRAASLDTEGFIHCSGSHDTLLAVGNSFYHRLPGRWLVLVIDENALDAPLQWDAVEGATFPHLYGPLNRSAVVEVVEFPRSATGDFLLPHAWRAAD